MNFSFKQRELEFIYIAVAAFVLGVALTWIATRKRELQGFNSTQQAVSFGPHNLERVLQQLRSHGGHNLNGTQMRSGLGQGDRTFMAVKVISTPGQWANHAQIQPTSEQSRFKKVFSFPYAGKPGSWHPLNHVNPAAGPGAHLNGGAATNIAYKLNNGDMFVLVSLS